MTLNTYQKVAITTIVATLFLILVGGLVRATGAGMGCPDWPKCFGQFIPPTHVSQLPADYKQVYLEQRLEKNAKIVSFLNSLGYVDLATKIENDPNVGKGEEFSAIKTWTEYINRLIGAIIGLLVLTTFITSLRYRQSKKSIPIASGLAVILTLFQAWLGSVVVSTNLLPGTITIHMIFAMVIVAVLLYGTYQAISDRFQLEIDEELRNRLYKISVCLLLVTTLQLVLGTQVREAIDAVKLTTDIQRAGWLEKTGLVFVIHRSFSWLVLLSALWIMSILWKKQVKGIIYQLGLYNFIMVLSQIAIGVGLEHLNMVAPLQVIHLVGVALMICAQFLLLLVLSKKEIKASRVNV